jgi:hypothetical protein
MIVYLANNNNSDSNSNNNNNNNGNSNNYGNNNNIINYSNNYGNKLSYSILQQTKLVLRFEIGLGSFRVGLHGRSSRLPISGTNFTMLVGKLTSLQNSQSFVYRTTNR